MFDELLDVFDRDRRGPADGPQRRRGFRGLLDRLAGDHDDVPRQRFDKWRDDDDDDAPRGARRRRDQDLFDFGD